MFTLLADAMFTATLARRGNDIPDHLKDYADRHVPRQQRKRGGGADTSYRNLW